MDKIKTEKNHWEKMDKTLEKANAMSTEHFIERVSEYVIEGNELVQSIGTVIKNITGDLFESCPEVYAVKWGYDHLKLKCDFHEPYPIWISMEDKIKNTIVPNRSSIIYDIEELKLSETGLEQALLFEKNKLDYWRLFFSEEDIRQAVEFELHNPGSNAYDVPRHISDILYTCPGMRSHLYRENIHTIKQNLDQWGSRGPEVKRKTSMVLKAISIVPESIMMPWYGGHEVTVTRDRTNIEGHTFGKN